MAVASRPNIWSFERFYTEVVELGGNNDRLFAWLISQGLMPQTRNCDICGNQMSLIFIDKYGFGTFRCKKVTRHPSGKVQQVSRVAGTLFQNTIISPHRLMTLIFSFAHNFPFEKCLEMISQYDITSRSTVSDWLELLRGVISERMLEEQSAEGKLGGVNKVIEVDETKFGQRKNHVGRIRDGTWILGIIERGSKRFRLEICPNNKRDADTLLPLIEKHVEQGSTIHTDKWKAYSALSRSGYFHFPVNHSQNFVDPVTGAHTQTIEASWRSLKETLRKNGIHADEKLGDRMMEFLFRRKCRLENIHPFDELIRYISLSYPGV